MLYIWYALNNFRKSHVSQFLDNLTNPGYDINFKWLLFYHCWSSGQVFDDRADSVGPDAFWQNHVWSSKQNRILEIASVSKCGILAKKNKLYQEMEKLLIGLSPMSWEIIRFHIPQHSTNIKALLQLRLTFHDCLITIGCLQTILLHLYCSLAVERLIFRQNQGRFWNSTSGHRYYLIQSKIRCGDAAMSNCLYFLKLLE